MNVRIEKDCKCLDWKMWSCLCNLRTGNIFVLTLQMIKVYRRDCVIPLIPSRGMLLTLEPLDFYNSSTESILNHKAMQFATLFMFSIFFATVKCEDLKYGNILPYLLLCECHRYFFFFLQGDQCSWCHCLLLLFITPGPFANPPVLYVYSWVRESAQKAFRSNTL